MTPMHWAFSLVVGILMWAIGIGFILMLAGYI